MVVAFFGHSDTPSEVYQLLESKIAELAEQNDELTCYVGAFCAKRIMRTQARLIVWHREH